MSAEEPRDTELTPREIVAELDKYIIGQKAAKKAVAIALRNRFRRRKLPAELADEIAPKNILMIGPTGVGKTEISRRLAKLTSSPFLKIEASKFTEVGYVGRDVESMIRDLVRMAVDMVKAEKVEEIAEKAKGHRRGADPRPPLPPAGGPGGGRRRGGRRISRRPGRSSGNSSGRGSSRTGRSRSRSRRRPRPPSRSSPTPASRTSACRSRRSSPASWAASPSGGR